MLSMRYTKYFDSCKGVFQGGGCKAIVYIGAYKEAYRRGVFFSELAGTSAGSVIAALIAAGASPDYLEKKVKGLDFKMFTHDYKKASGMTKWLLKWKFPTSLKDKVKYLNVDAIRENWGIFDNQVVERFVEECLTELMGKSGVTFSELIPNLHIICADLQRHRVKIWDKGNTPKASVAKAVCSSCSIPFFFQPVDGRYVDGGLLSNLPNFVFSNEPHYNRILCFRNLSPEASGTINDFEGFVKALLNTVPEGSEDIQKFLTAYSYDVPIKVEGVSSTDFDKIDNAKIDELINIGEKAMAEFLDKETVFMSNNGHKSADYYENEEKVHSLVSYISLEKYKEVCISNDDTYWAWILFLSVVKWINDGTKVSVFVSRSIQYKYAEEETARRRMLIAMGCKVVEIDHMTVKGFFFYNNDLWSGITFEKEKNSFLGKYYNSPLDSPLIKEWILKYKKEAGEYKNNKRVAIGIRETDEKYLTNLLRNESTYSEADLSFEQIDLDKVLFLNPFIRALKYKQIKQMFDMYGENIAKFGAASFIFPNGKESVIGPPVVEEHNGKYYVIEGNTRCIYAYRHGIKRLKMVVARNVCQPLPCKEDDTYRISQVLISDQKLEGETRYNGFDYSLFRHIEKSLRPYETYML